MFRGLHEHNIDAKGRMSVPSEIRAALGKGKKTSRNDKLIITTGLDRCLVGYPVQRWQDFEKKLATLSQFDPAVVQLKRIYVAGATECPIDKHGRILIPPMLREYAGLSREVVWAGMVTTIELWAKESWNKHSQSARENRDEIVQALTQLGL